MQERMTWTEIKEKYPEQWIGLVDIDWENDGMGAEGDTVRMMAEEIAMIKKLREKNLDFLEVQCAGKGYYF